MMGYAHFRRHGSIESFYSGSKLLSFYSTSSWVTITVVTIVGISRSEILWSKWLCIRSQIPILHIYSLVPSAWANYQSTRDLTRRSPPYLFVHPLLMSTNWVTVSTWCTVLASWCTWRTLPRWVNVYPTVGGIWCNTLLYREIQFPFNSSRSRLRVEVRWKGS